MGVGRSPTRGTVTAPARGWRESLEADPLGLAKSGKLAELGEPEDGGPTGPPPTPASQRAALLRLLVVIALIVALGYLAGVGETVVLVLAFFACIVLHELGHFATAKWAGIKVTEFFVGFGPRLWSVCRGETEYGVKALPLGGYCRIIGMNNLEEVDPADEPRTYRQAPLWRRLSVGLAGSAMHFLIAICLLFAMFFGTGSNANYVGTLPANARIMDIEGLTTGQSPAHAAGFKVGDRIVAVDGKSFATFDQLSAYIQGHPGRRLDVTVDRDGKLVNLFPTTVDLSKVQPVGPNGKPAEAPATYPTGFLGIAPDPIVHHGFADSLNKAGGTWVDVSTRTLSAFGRLVTFHGLSNYGHMLTSQKAADNPSNGVRFESAVGVVRLFHQAGQQGLSTVLYLLAVINLSLGIFNLIPLLPLDGGHVAIALYEGIRSRRRRYHADVAKLLPVVYMALAAIVFLGVSALFLDLRDIAT